MICVIICALTGISARAQEVSGKSPVRTIPVSDGIATVITDKSITKEQFDALVNSMAFTKTLRSSVSSEDMFLYSEGISNFLKMGHHPRYVEDRSSIIRGILAKEGGTKKGLEITINEAKKQEHLKDSLGKELQNTQRELADKTAKLRTLTNDNASLVNEKNSLTQQLMRAKDELLAQRTPRETYKAPSVKAPKILPKKGKIKTTVAKPKTSGKHTSHPPKKAGKKKK